MFGVSPEKIDCLETSIKRSSGPFILYVYTVIMLRHSGISVVFFKIQNAYQCWWVIVADVQRWRSFLSVHGWWSWGGRGFAGTGDRLCWTSTAGRLLNRRHRLHVHRPSDALPLGSRPLPVKKQIIISIS